MHGRADAVAVGQVDIIAHADLITIGPGSLYTSLITNLLVQGIPTALASARGLRVYICNLMSQANESLNLTASQHIERIYDHARAPIFDYALVNTAEFSADTLAPEITAPKQHKVNALVGQRPEEMGYKAAMVMHDLAEGKTEPPVIHTGLDTCTWKDADTCLKH